MPWGQATAETHLQKCCLASGTPAVPTEACLEIPPMCPAENTQIPIWREGFGFLFSNTVLVFPFPFSSSQASGFILFQKGREASSCHCLSPGVSTAAPPPRALQCWCSFSSLKPHSAPSSKTKVFEEENKWHFCSAKPQTEQCNECSSVS